jgi:hypothetical protein
MPCSSQAESDVSCTVQVLLNRNPSERPTAEGLKKVLEDHDNTGTVGSFTSPWIDNLYSNLS